jgi:hypothetical protein
MRCWLTRWRLSTGFDRRDPDRDPVSSTDVHAAHVARCARCRDFARRLERLHRRLATSAAGAPPPMTTAARRRLPRALVAGAALATGAAALFLLTPSRPARQLDRAVASAPEPASPVHHAGEERTVPMSGALGRARAPAHELVSGLSVLFSAPPRLQAELDALAADGRRAALAVLDLGGVRGWAESIR